MLFLLERKPRQRAAEERRWAFQVRRQPFDTGKCQRALESLEDSVRPRDTGSQGSNIRSQDTVRPRVLESSYPAHFDTRWSVRVTADNLILIG